MSIREERKENGLCEYCGKPLDRIGIQCIECNDKWSKYKFENYTLTKHYQKLCTDCGKTLDRDGWFCKSCVNKLRLRGKDLADYRRQHGLCVQCGTPADGYSYCQKHRDERMERYYKIKGV